MSTHIDSSLSGEPAEADDAGVPTEAEIEELRKEIDRLDAEILAAVKRRTEVSRMIGRTRMASGGTRLVHSREMKVLERFSELGQEGHTLAMLLLRLGRGRLGH
ncbi:probable chorismate mutase [Rhodococcus gordoniae]|uniref:Probable chorismate mutase n=1 Tax=Rhodococcus gordoniae TaxID=223392 RepID=A0A379M3J6_9NOCA|nr:MULTISPECIES: chorismate mutase [Rhodococcus]MBS9373582.1 Intracellular chorismate mutase [Rhodococcus sp. B50]UTT49481.1 chorismate mutase [Rhodococcus gordoniae]SUE16891.1 probable chorismate mutase [Rhodococcus gordoniae]